MPISRVEGKYMDSISFKANYIKPLQVLKIDEEGLKPQKAAFVEFRPADIETVNEINHDIGWLGGRRAFDKRSFETGHIYGLTTQTDSFHKINPDKVLGLVTTTDKNDIITSIRLRAEAKTPAKKSLLSKIFNYIYPSGYYKEERQYKKVGSALLDGLKHVTDDIAVFSPKKYAGFFIKNGFLNPIPKDKNYLKWVRK